MPGRALPKIPLSEVRSKNTAKCCYVTIGTNVYDVTSFVEDHPGGPEFVLEYAGQDITKILKDEVSHTHSDSAYEILEELLVGVLSTELGSDSKTGEAEVLYSSTGMSCEEDLSKETDITKDYRTHKFLDLNKPLLMQVWNGGFEKDFYLEQVHRPRHYKGGESAPIFGNFLEPLSKTPWWVIPTVWLPPVAYGTFLAATNLPSIGHTVGYWLFGLAFWTIVEYCLHRFLFHMEYYLPNNRVGITLHFLLHGIHHYLPMDKYRLVMPPTLFIVLALPFWKFAHTIFFYNWYAATAAYCGGIFGYVCYDCTHYFLHHQALPPYWHKLKKYHLAHHFADFQNGFGVTSWFWDWVFETQLEMAQPKLVKAS